MTHLFIAAVVSAKMFAAAFYHRSMDQLGPPAKLINSRELIHWCSLEKALVKAFTRTASGSSVGRMNDQNVRFCMLRNDEKHFYVF